jgi:fructose-specific phosphotransferase system IIC component
MVIVFILTLLMAVFIANYTPNSAAFIFPLIGGLIAGYLVDGNYTDAIVNGAIPVGLAGYVYTLSIPGLIFYLGFGILGGLLGFVIKERKIIKHILS